MAAAAIARGAVDLSALKARTPAKAAPPGPQQGDPEAMRRPAAGSDGAGGVTIIDVTEATFQSEVLERSLHTPVVIDFWAEWCEPCKQLSPVLEKLAVESGGSWVLAKVDVDANQRLAATFRVQSIPMVYAVISGQPVDGFAGVVPESQLRQWIDALLEAARQAEQAPQGGGGVPAATDERFDAAEDALGSGDFDGAEQIYQRILAEKPADPVAEAGLAQVRLLRRTEGLDAGQVISRADAAPDDIAAQRQAADMEVLSGLADRAYARLVEVVRRAGGAEREAVRTHLVSLFAMASPDDPVVAKARRDLANALF
jgi:putative thioredoxin